MRCPARPFTLPRYCAALFTLQLPLVAQSFRVGAIVALATHGSQAQSRRVSLCMVYAIFIDHKRDLLDPWAVVLAGSQCFWSLYRWTCLRAVDYLPQSRSLLGGHVHGDEACASVPSVSVPYMSHRATRECMQTAPK
jgi:hypothetical protein